MTRINTQKKNHMLSYLFKAAATQEYKRKKTALVTADGEHGYLTFVLNKTLKRQLS